MVNATNRLDAIFVAVICKSCDHQPRCIALITSCVLRQASNLNYGFAEFHIAYELIGIFH